MSSKATKKKKTGRDNSIDKIVDDIYDDNFSDREIQEKRLKARQSKGSKEGGSIAESGNEATELDFMNGNNVTSVEVPPSSKFKERKNGNGSGDEEEETKDDGQKKTEKKGLKHKKTFRKQYRKEEQEIKVRKSLTKYKRDKRGKKLKRDTNKVEASEKQQKSRVFDQEEIEEDDLMAAREITETEYLNMIVCHSVVIESKDIFDQFKKTLLVHMEEEELTPGDDRQSSLDKLKENLRTIFSNEDFSMTLKNPEVTNVLVAIINEGLKCSIHLRKSLITTDIINFSLRYQMPLKITEREIESLLLNEDFTVIEKLIERRAIYQLRVPFSVHEDQIKNEKRKPESLRRLQTAADLKALRMMSLKNVAAAASSDTEMKYHEVEKHLNISDFLKYILEFRETFSSKDPSSPEFNDDLFDMITDFLIKTQFSIDLSKVSRILIDNHFHKQFIGVLEANDIEIDDFETRQKFLQQAAGNQALSFYTPSVRRQFIKAMLTEAIDLQFFDVASEIVSTFLSTILKFYSLAAIDTLIEQFRANPKKVEARVFLASQLMPIMSRKQGERLCQALQDALGESSEACIYRFNVNPFKLSLMIFKLADDLCDKYGQLEFLTNTIKDSLKEHMLKIMSTFSSHREIVPIIESVDFNGNDCFWYLLKYQLYDVLNSQVIDQYIQDKYVGRLTINSTVLDYSTGYRLFRNKFDLFSGDKLYSEIRGSITNFNLAQLTHSGKFFAWRRSMKFRFYLSALATLIFTLVFQYYVTHFNTDLHISLEELKEMHILKKEGEETSPKFEELRADFAVEMDRIWNDLIHILVLSAYTLAYPLTFLQRKLLAVKTGKKEVGEFSLTDLLSLSQTLLTVFIFLNIQWFGKIDHSIDNNYIEEGFTRGQIFTANIVFELERNTYRFDFLLAAFVFIIWLKFFMIFRMTRAFGPMFKVLWSMVIDLSKFLTVWVVLISLFTCVTMVLFSKNPNFDGLEKTFIYFVQASLGNYDMSTFTATPTNAAELEIEDIPQEVFDKEAELMTDIGIYYLLIFLLINMILMLNFVIAILSQTFGDFEPQKLGLYYEILLNEFPYLEYDERFGSVLLGVEPLNVIPALCCWPLFLMDDPKWQTAYNNFVCHLIFLPIAILQTLAFTLVNTFILMPGAYILHFLAMLSKAVAADGAMEKIRSTASAIEFVLNGLIFLAISIFTDPLKLICNIYTRPHTDDFEDSEAGQEVSREAFNLFEEVCDDIEVLAGVKTGHSHLVETASFNKKLQLKFRLISEIYALLFVGDAEKFVFDKRKKRHVLNPKYLKKLNEFNKFKILVISSAEPHSDLVDISVLKSFIEQIDLRIMILQVNMQQGRTHLPRGRKIEDVFLDSIKELVLTRPNQVVDAMKESEETVDTMNTKLDIILQKIEALESRDVREPLAVGETKSVSDF